MSLPSLLLIPSSPPTDSLSLVPSEDDFEKHGMRRTVEGLLIVHEHGHPHVLLLQVANSFFKLPGDYLKPGEGDIDGLKKRMQKRLGPENELSDTTMDNGWDDKLADGWEIADAVGQFYRPNFEGFMVSPVLPRGARSPRLTSRSSAQYPYIPA